MQILVYKTYLQCELQILSFVRNICKIYMYKIDWNVINIFSETTRLKFVKIDIKHRHIVKIRICFDHYLRDRGGVQIVNLIYLQVLCMQCRFRFIQNVTLGQNGASERVLKIYIGIRNKNVYDPLDQSCPAGRVNDYFLGIPWNISNSKKIINSLSK